MATFGSMPNILPVSAEEIAMSASCSEVGLGFTAQSPKTDTRLGKHIKKTEDTVDTPGFVFTNCKAGRMVCWVVCKAPDTMPSASPLYTIIVPKYETSCIRSRAISMERF